MSCRAWHNLALLCCSARLHTLRCLCTCSCPKATPGHVHASAGACSCCIGASTRAADQGSPCTGHAHTGVVVWMPRATTRVPGDTLPTSWRSTSSVTLRGSSPVGTSSGRSCMHQCGRGVSSWLTASPRLRFWSLHAWCEWGTRSKVVGSSKSLQLLCGAGKGNAHTRLRAD